MSGNVYEAVAPCGITALNLSYRIDQGFRLAFSSSVLHSSPNAVVQILRFGDFQMSPPTRTLAFHHPVRTPSMLHFLPHSGSQHPDLFATAADSLRIWRIDDGTSVRLSSDLINTDEAPATHLRVLDWNLQATHRISTLNSDGVCAIWDIAIGRKELQLFTDLPVHAVQDVAWGSSDLLASAYSDGTVKFVDLRVGLRAHTVYRLPGGFADRVVWNYRDPNYMAVTGGGSMVVVLDPRRPQPVAEMHRHTASVNAIAWDPHSRHRICTVGQDAQALVWAIPAEGRTLMTVGYTADSALQQLKWSWLLPWRVAFATENRLHIVDVPP